MRDMPAPRRNPSLLGGLFARAFAWPYRAILAGFLKTGVRAWMLTAASLATNVAVGILLLMDRRLVPGLLLIPAGLFDVFDGAIARQRGEDSRMGAFLDSMADRVSDLAVFGCLFWSLSGEGMGLAAGLALATLVISLGVSHVRAEAEADGVSLSEGVFQRLERHVALILGLCIPHVLLPVLGVLAVLGGVTLLQRLWSAGRRLAKPSQPA